METILVRYTVKYELSFAPNYKWTICGRCYNSKTGRLLKQVYKNGMIGYCIQSKFYSLKSLRKNLQKITNIEIPF